MKPITLAAALALAAGAAFAQDRAGWPDSFTVATASEGGTFHAYGTGWTALVASALGLRGTAEITGGPMQNMALVHTGDSAFGMTTMGPAAESVAGENPIAPGLPLDRACAMFPMYQTPFSLVALAASGIGAVADIPDGSRIGFGPPGSTSDSYFPAMLDRLGVAFERRNGSWEDLARQLQDGLIQVIAIAAGIPVPAVSQLEVQAEIAIVPFTETEQAQLTAGFPVAAYEIPQATYRSLAAPARSVAMWNFAIVNCELPDSLIYAVTDVVMSDHARMLAIHPAAAETLPENWDKNRVLKWHPGAARWFREHAGAQIPDAQVY